MINANLRATFALARELLPGMIERKYGRIVTMSSSIGYMGIGGSSFSTYAASKTSLVGLTKGIAHEGAPYVTANAIVPCIIRKETAEDRGEAWPPEPMQDDTLLSGVARADEPVGKARRHCSGGQVPGVRRILFHHRPGDPGQRRHSDALNVR